MKDAIAIWLDSQDTQLTTELMLHVNLWISKERAHYLEFGLKIEGPQNIKKVNLFVPYQISKTDVEDMAEKLATPDLTNALFNENMTLSAHSGKMHLATSDNPEKNFSYYFFDNEEIEVNYVKDEGSIISLSLNVIESTKNPAYCRIRINKVDHMLREYSKNISSIEGLLKDLITTEISINTIRKLPRRIVGKLSKNTKLNSIKVFLMTDISTELVFQSEEIKSTRILEEDIWNDYLGIKNKKSIFRCIFPDKRIYKTVAYQWKEESKDNNGKYIAIDDYTLFVKFHRVKKAKVLIVFSIMLLIGLGVISGVLGNYSTNYIDTLLDSNQTKEVSKNGNGTE